jgi:hypothetical protein
MHRVINMVINNVYQQLWISLLGFFVPTFPDPFLRLE